MINGYYNSKIKSIPVILISICITYKKENTLMIIKENYRDLKTQLKTDFEYANIAATKITP